jgi:hypothetical protein
MDTESGGELPKIKLLCRGCKFGDKAHGQVANGELIERIDIGMISDGVTSARKSFEGEISSPNSH